MAALLRQGARRIGGSVLQRTQAALTSPAVAEERRRLVPRRMYSTEEQASEELARTIQQKKEELYDLIALGEMNDRTSSWTNAWLIQYLSEEITPRPSDSFLQAVQKTRRVYSGIRRAGLITLSFLATDYFLYNNKGRRTEGSSGHDDGRTA
uniref:Uncharacterized protein n=1 Tax=Avena sativa TaxID=4498 RepID=A0ACD5U0T7_AVESA